jgi:hypothetical protein
MMHRAATPQFWFFYFTWRRSGLREGIGAV